MALWYTSPVVEFTLGSDSRILPLIASRINREGSYTDANGVVHRHYYEVPVYSGRGISFAYEAEPPAVGSICLVRIEDQYQSVDRSTGEPVMLDNPEPGSEYVTKIVDWTQFAVDHPDLVGKFEDQPTG